MYHVCIFCSADLKANDALERFPVGRSIAFDAQKGRLWAVCPRCARWNLAPIEERWEAIEDAERLFHDTRTRVQSENIGLARLRDGTRLVRVGRALDGELAAWRYGGMLRRRRRRYLAGAGAAVAGTAVATGSLLTGIAGAAVLLWAGLGGYGLLKKLTRPPVHRFEAGTLLRHHAVWVGPQTLRGSQFALTPAGEVSLLLPLPGAFLLDSSYECWRQGSLLIPAEHARTLLRRGMVRVNAAGAAPDRVQTAVNLLSASRSAEGFRRRAALTGAPMDDAALDRWVRGARMLAVEMAVHEEMERDALQGELAALQEMWRQAEEIAAIADRLPDDVPASGPPRLYPGR
jgi:hypothetical protein